jgi:hypothetical protein
MAHKKALAIEQAGFRTLSPHEWWNLELDASICGSMLQDFRNSRKKRHT